MQQNPGKSNFLLSNKLISRNVFFLVTFFAVIEIEVERLTEYVVFFLLFEFVNFSMTQLCRLYV